jgi:REP element-mobilizing transposase RayT
MMGKLWQKSYHEHIIRDERAYENIADYIVNNPQKWEEDKFYNK